MRGTSVPQTVGSVHVPTVSTTPAAFAADCLACRLTRERGEPDDHARHELWAEAKVSAANRTLNKLVELLEEAGDLIDKFTDSHGDGCPCAFCTHIDWYQTGLGSNELFGMQWSLDMAVSVLENAMIKTDDATEDEDAENLDIHALDADAAIAVVR